MRSLLLSFALIALWAPRASARSEGVDDRHVADLRDLNRVDQLHREASLLLDQGEAAFLRGDFSEAARLFARASQQAPESALLARRLCQAQTDQGLRLAAIDSCKQALRNGGSPMDMRALARAVASSAPSAMELSLALQAARQAKRAMPDQPWGYAAECDIAIRLGDEAMFQSCRAELTRIAPRHYETQRLARVRSINPWFVRTSWLLLAFGVLGTALHALHRSLLRSGAAAVVLPVLLVAAPAMSAPEAARDGGSGLSKWPLNHENPSASVPSPAERDENPLQYGYFLMDLGVAADAALAKNEPARAAKYYEAMAKAVPDEAYGNRKACENYALAGEREQALRTCAAALTMKNVVVDDYVRFSKLQLQISAPLSPEQIDGMNQIVAHLEGQPNGVLAAAQVECELGTRLEDVKRVRHCVDVLARGAPADPKTFTYRWALALQESDFPLARRVIAEAKKASLDAKAIQHMERATEERGRIWNRLARYWKIEATLLLALGVALLLRNALWRRGRLTSSSVGATPLA